jgi:predicted NBD/HSP70 family sugar kinase
MRIRLDGRHCHCGARGCWETEIGAEAILVALGRQDAPGSAADVIAEVLQRGDPAELGRLEPVGRALGLGLANAVNVLNPSLVILGTMLAQIYPVVADVARKTLYQTALQAPGEQVELAVPMLGADAVLMGAAEVAWQDLLADPSAVLADGAAATVTGLREALGPVS